jgi:hypothetical protein
MTPSMQPILHRDVPDFPTIETDAGLQFDPLKAEANEQFDVITARNALSPKESAHQPVLRALSKHQRTRLAPLTPRRPSRIL